MLYGASVQAQDDAGYTPLHSAAANGHITPSLLLLQHGADPNIQCHRGNTPLHLAAKWDHVDVVKALLKFRADVRIRNENAQLAVAVSLRGLCFHKTGCEILSSNTQ
jgi:ankyrin repeat protein